MPKKKGHPLMNLFILAMAFFLLLGVGMLLYAILGGSLPNILPPKELVTL